MVLQPLNAYVLSSWNWAGDLGAGMAMYVMLTRFNPPHKVGEEALSDVSPRSGRKPAVSLTQ